MSLFRLNPVILLAGLAAGAASALQPGTYTAEVNGHNAPLTVKVTVDANRITSIDTSKNLETIGEGAFYGCTSATEIYIPKANIIICISKCHRSNPSKTSPHSIYL